MIPKIKEYKDSLNVVDPFRELKHERAIEQLGSIGRDAYFIPNTLHQRD